MKKLNEYLYESLLDDEEELIKDDTILIEQFLNDNYIINGTYRIKNKIVDVNGIIRISWDVQSDITNLTNEMFEFGTINGDFIINDCIKLKTLKGGPKKVNGDFSCSFCENLKSFEYAPYEIDGCFLADACNITTLKGLPKHLNLIRLSRCNKLIDLKYIPDANEYIFDDCKNLKSLIGLPQDHEYSLNISGCKKLNSLEGCYKKMGYLDIGGCNLDSLEGGPEFLSGNLYMSGSNIKSLEGFPGIVKGIIYAVKTKLPVTSKQFKEEFIPQNVKFYQGINI